MAQPGELTGRFEDVYMPFIKDKLDVNCRQRFCRDVPAYVDEN